MIKNNIEYLNLIVPNEYRCVYYNILDTLGTLGEDLLSSCTATCKGRAINGIACYNMFIAACACYYLGLVKRARILISYIKAQLDISCDKNITFENSSNDEWIYLTVPKIYQCVFEKLLNKLATWGQELLDDCTVSCKGQNKNILNCWNLFNAACIAYEIDGISKANSLINYIQGILGFNCPNIEPEPEPGYDYPAIKDFSIVYKHDADNHSINIISGIANYYNQENLVENSLKLININTNQVILDNLSISNNLVFNVFNYYVEYDTDIKFALIGTDKKGNIIKSNEFVINIHTQDLPDPNLKINNVIYSKVNNQIILRYIVIKSDHPSLFNSDGWNIAIKVNDEQETIIKTNVLPTNGTGVLFEDTIYDIPVEGLTLIITAYGTGINGRIYSDFYSIVAQQTPVIPKPVITITNVNYNFFGGYCNILSVEATVENPDSISAQGLTLKVVPQTVEENIPCEATILIDNIDFRIQAGMYMTNVVLEGMGLDGEIYAGTYPLDLNPDNQFHL